MLDPTKFQRSPGSKAERKKNELPEIRIIRIEKLVLHEIEDPERTKRLEERLRADGFLKNPVIVGKVKRNGSGFLLLDGVHRVNGLKKLGCRDVVAQIIDYAGEDLTVHTWYHLIYGFEPQYLLRKIKDIGDVILEKTNRKRAEMLLKQKKIVSYLLFKNGDIFAIKSKDDVKTRTAKLTDVVNVYGASSQIYRASKGEVDFLLKESKDATAVLVIPVYEKKDIVNLAFDDVKLPAGITRHVVPKRVLGLSIDLALLKVDIPIENKNKLLQEIIKQRVVNKRTRFYPEPVFVFNE